MIFRQKLLCATAILLIASCSGSLVTHTTKDNSNEPNTFAGLSQSKHAIDPLTQSELEAAVLILKKENLLGQGWYLQVLNTAEPHKTPDGHYPVYDANSRKAYAVVLNRQLNERYECVVDLQSQTIVSKKAIDGQPAILDFEFVEVANAVRSDPKWQKSMNARGITKHEDVFVDVWGPGEIAEPEIDQSHRILRASFYLKEDSPNSYARPIEGVSIIYDAVLGQVVKVIDTGITPISPHKQDYTSSAQKESPKPADCSGAASSFQVSADNQVSWKNWRFRFQMHPREGLVIYDVGQMDQGRFRSILDRASLSEMVVPYSDPTQNWYWRAAFDEGDYGLGNNANPMQRGVHYPVDAQTFDSLLTDYNGKVFIRPNTVAIYERSAGLLWSHWNADGNLMTARSSKELVASFVFTVGNYDYGISWVFKENGSIQMQAILTGMLLTKGHKIASCGRCGKLSRADQFGMLVDTNLVATAHQHFFNFRLDFAVDGPMNSVAEISLEETPDTIKNPLGNSYLINEHVLETEAEAMRNPSAHHAKHWWFFNENKKNRLGHFHGIVLEPGESGGYFGKPHSHVLRAAPFLAHSLHVTQYHPDEMHAAGDFPSQATKPDGLKHWIGSRNASIRNKNLVAWYTLGVTHLPVLEDWPIMPIHKTGFTLKPMNFFDQAQGVR